MLKDPDNFRCSWCGNPVLGLTWEDILDMAMTYREIEGRHAIRHIADHLEMDYQNIYNWLENKYVPNYITGRKAGMFLKSRFSALKDEDVREYLQLYPHVSI